jgi:hypothetical protein
MNVAVLIICFKRSDNVRKLLTSICEQGATKVYLAIDGPRDSDTSIGDLIETESREIARRFGVDFHLWNRESNLGPAVSVITAIDWLFSFEKAGIILEDDLVISNNLLQYFDFMLNRFESNQDVMMLSGTQFVNSQESEEFRWTSYPVIWGWASWSDRWDMYRDQIALLNRSKIKGARKERRYWKTGLRRCSSGVQDAWDIPLAVSQLAAEKKTILPPVNLISNQGVDEFAGNTVKEAWPLNMEICQLPSNYVDFEFDVKNLDSSLDEFIRREVYNLNNLRILPAFLSRLLDYFRFPGRSRKSMLIDRLSQVGLPNQ